MEKRVEIPSLCAWKAEIALLKAEGKTVCPFMVREEGRFRPERTLCDIPQTRRTVIAESGTCSDNDHCLPRILKPQEASAEHSPQRPSQRRYFFDSNGKIVKILLEP